MPIARVVVVAVVVVVGGRVVCRVAVEDEWEVTCEVLPWVVPVPLAQSVPCWSRSAGWRCGSTAWTLRLTRRPWTRLRWQ